MRAFDLKIPPPVVLVLIAGAMWGISAFPPFLRPPAAIRVAVAVAIVLAGVGISLAALVSFRRARTTIDPMKPDTASSLVCSGIYRVSRNPMYLGLLILLVALAVILSSAWASLGPALFALYITRFQIIPEERALSGRFGAGYAAYTSRVRRWL